MTLIYRSIWKDDRSNLVEDVRAEFAEWVLNRSGGQIEAMDPGRYSAKEIGTLGGHSDLDVTVEHTESGGGMFRGSYLLHAVGGERWHTVVRSWVDRENNGWCWVDNSVVGDNISHLHSIDIIAPKMTMLLLRRAVNPRVGETLIADKPFLFESMDTLDALEELITDFERTIPVVVFARNERRYVEYGGRGFTFDDIVACAAKRLAGIAVVAVAGEEVADELTEHWGREHGVFGGAFRVYVKDVDPAVAETARHHRYVTADRYMRQLGTAASLIGRIVGPRSALRRPPGSFDEAKSRLDDESSLELRIEKLQIELDQAKSEVIEAREERDVLLTESSNAARLQRQLDYAMQLLVRSRVSDEFDEDGRGGFIETPPQTPQEAVDRAKKYLSDRLTIHPEALRSERDIRGAEWCSKAWSGFRALHAYGEHCAQNPQSSIDFSNWLKNFGVSLGWSPSEVAIGETSSVRGDSGLWKKRMFPVDKRVDPNGKTRMVAHLKIGRSDRDSPRIYFIWSPITKKVHVGFYGPHNLVPNTKSSRNQKKG